MASLQDLLGAARKTQAAVPLWGVLLAFLALALVFAYFSGVNQSNKKAAQRIEKAEKTAVTLTAQQKTTEEIYDSPTGPRAVYHERSRASARAAAVRTAELSAAPDDFHAIAREWSAGIDELRKEARE